MENHREPTQKAQSDTMEHVRAFQGITNLEEIQAYLTAQQDPFKPSELYSSKDKTKVLDREQRRSEYRRFKDKTLFALMEQVVQQLSATDANYSYLLHKNDITEIRYRKGDFFNRHTDYLSMTSNCIEEFTLILCVTPSALAANVKGGETLLYPFNQTKPHSFDCMTPGCGLVFRKDLEHAGKILDAGEKHILTANLWAMRKPKSSRVLLVTFPAEEKKNEAALSGAATCAMAQVANQDSSYALPVDLLAGTMLATIVDCNRLTKGEGEDLPAILTYECTRYTAKEFGTVAKILQRSYVHEEEIKVHKDCIDYFGPFPPENLFSNLALEPPEGAAPPTKVPKHQNETKDDTAAPEASDLFVCENESRTKVVCEVARQLGEPYVPFKMLFVEGILQWYDSDMGHAGYSSVPMTPVACLVGDYNNVFMLRKVNNREFKVVPQSLKDMHEKHNFWDQIPDWGKEGLLEQGTGEHVSLEDGYKTDDLLSDDDNYDLEEKFRRDGMGLSLKVAYGHGPFQEQIMTYIFDDPENDAADFFVLLPGSAEHEEELDESVTDENDSNKIRLSCLFHRDAEGRIAFTADEAERASNFIASVGLEERVKASLQKKRFELPQESTEMEGFFCNDSTIYGKLNLLWITGVIRLEDSKPAPDEQGAIKTIDFDAWPKESDKMDPRTFRKEGLGIYPSDEENEGYEVWEEI